MKPDVFVYLDGSSVIAGPSRVRHLKPIAEMLEESDEPRWFVFGGLDRGGVVFASPSATRLRIRS